MFHVCESIHRTYVLTDDHDPLQIFLDFKKKLKGGGPLGSGVADAPDRLSITPKKFERRE
jgi:hypothetical protein